MNVLVQRRSISHTSAAGARTLNEVGKYLLLMVLLMVFIGPFLWLLSTALKQTTELGALPIHFWPTQPQWGNFAQAFTTVKFGPYAANSLILSTLSALLTTFSSAIVGFGFARLRGPGKRWLFLVMLSTMMLPQLVVLIPTYVLFARLSLVDTYWPWVLWGLASSPFIAFLFRQSFSSIPVELEEAAIIDGCGYGRIFWQIFLPLSIPVIATSLIFTFTWTWGDYITPSLLLSQDNTTLSVAMASGYVDPHGVALTNILAAGSIMYILPVLIIFFFAQRSFVKGIVTTGLKG